VFDVDWAEQVLEGRELRRLQGSEDV
jgi:hypothetical protein